MDVPGFLKAIYLMAETTVAQKQYLTELDSAIGDADHGINMERGFSKVAAKLQSGSYSDLGDLSKDVAMVLMQSVGGASGPIYGTLFMRMSMKLKGNSEMDLPLFSQAFDAGLQGICDLGKAELGDKTMVDALTPAVEALHEALERGENLASGLDAAVEAVRKGMEETIPMVARKGRASYLGDRSAGHQDPGATSSYYLLSAFRDAAKAEGA
ncbi:MAG TPA: dihydroxyacetone kinase subunit DhaL [Synergistaceae bacterium]|nr:dihydroxyacetone kinase subunit DhaL [Synergistaceae bacterium]